MLEIRRWSEVRQAVVAVSSVKQLLIGPGEMAIARTGQLIHPVAAASGWGRRVKHSVLVMTIC
jgi:hypothetical protein